MNGAMLGHWGLVCWPNNDVLENVLIGEDGSFSKFDDDSPVRINFPDWIPLRWNGDTWC